MKREWKPGDVAIIAGADPTAEGVRAIWQGNQWATCTGRYFNDWQVEVRRALVVIDPEDREQVARLDDAIARVVDNYAAGHCGGVDALQNGLREFANPTPPKPDEPKGLGAVVVDDEQVMWVRMNWTHWYSEAYPNNRQTWDEIDAVKVLSDGFDRNGLDEPMADWERALLEGDS